MKLEDLKAPFDSDRVSWRIGSTDENKTRGLALAYIDARDVQDRLDAVCGPENWSNRYLLLGQTTICEISIKIGSEWVSKADGAGATDVEGEKGALSDAFKRSAVKWGVGRYLYDLDSPWVRIEPAGRSFKIAATEKERLRKLLMTGEKTTMKDMKEHEKFEAAAEWVEQSIEHVFQLETVPEVREWERKALDAITRLQKVNPGAFEKLQDKITLRYDQLQGTKTIRGADGAVRIYS